jgi:hypothetical protein
MADKKVSLEVEITAKGGVGATEKSVKSIKTELREAREEAMQMSRQFGELSPEATKAAAKLAGLRDEMEDLNKKVQGLNPDKFARLAGLTNGVVRGFQAAQGAAVLFGKTGENIEKSIAKLQATMALADGIQGVLDAKKQFVDLGNQIKGNVVKAFSTLKGAIIATGIGALVVVLGLVIANFDKVKKYVLNLFPGLETLGKWVGGLVDKFTDLIGVTTEQGRALEKSVEQQKTALEKLNGWMDRNLDKYNKFTADKFKADLEYKEAKLKLDEELNKGLDQATYNQHLKELQDKKTRAVEKADLDRKAEADSLAEKKKADLEKIKQDRKTAAEKLEDERQAKLKEDLELLNGLNKTAQTKSDAAIKEFERQEEIKKINKEAKTLDIQKTADDQKKADEAIEKADKEHQDTLVNNARVAEEAKNAIQMQAVDNLERLGGLLVQVAGKNKQLAKVGLGIELAAGIAKMVIANRIANAGALSTPQAILTSGAAAAPVIAMNNISTALGIAASIAATATAMKQLGGGGSQSTPPSSGGGVGYSAPQTGFTQIRTPQFQTQGIGEQKYPVQKVVILQKDIADAGKVAVQIKSKAVLK